MNDTKDEFVCAMCDIILNDPIILPCESLCYNEHLNDHFVEKNKIICSKCKQTFNVSKDDFRVPHKSITPPHFFLPLPKLKYLAFLSYCKRCIIRKKLMLL